MTTFIKTAELIEALEDNEINDIAFINVYFFREKAYIYDSISIYDGKDSKTCAIIPIRVIVQHNKGHKPLFTDFTEKFKQLFKDTVRFTFTITPSRKLRQAHKVNIYRINPNSKTFKTDSETVSYYPTSVIVDMKQVKLLDSLLKEFDSSPNAKYEKDKNNNENDDEIYSDSLLSLIH